MVEHAHGRGVSWERFQWSCAGVRYSFEVQSGGLHGRIRSDAGHQLTLPMVAWEGLLDCVRAQKKARSQAAAVDLPPRSGARWTKAESDELSAGYRAGTTIAALAQHHQRTRGAIQSELERLGLVISPYALSAPGGAAMSHQWHAPPHQPALPPPAPAAAQHDEHVDLHRG